MNPKVVSELSDFPGEKKIPTIGYIGKMPEIVALPKGFNQARSLIGSLKIPKRKLDVKEIMKQFDKYLEPTSRMREIYLKVAQAISDAYDRNEI